MSHPDRTIPQRELRNNISEVLREVSRGARIRVTVQGAPVADLVPVSGRATWVPRESYARIIQNFPLDRDFETDVAAVLGNTIDELWTDS